VETISVLIERAVDGDVPLADRLAAFGQLVQRFQDMVYGCAYAILGDFHLAQDAAQEAFLTAYRELPKLRQPRAFPAWLRRIVISQCRRITRRKRLSTTALDTAAAVPSTVPQPGEALEKREMKDKVLAAIRALPDHQRMATTLFYINGYSQKDIAEFLEVPVTTVKKRLADSRTRLKERMVAMVKNKLKKHSLPEEFTQRVLSFAEIIKHGEDKDYTFQFANGVRVRTRIDKVFQDKNQLHLLFCGPTEIICHSGKPWPGSPDSFSFDSFVLIPGSLVTITQTEKVDKDGLECGELPSNYEIVGPEEPKYEEKTRYIPSPISTGPLEISPDGCFAFIRIGKDQRSYKFRGRGQDTKEYNWHSSADDIYVSEEQLQNYHLRQGDIVKCTWRRAVGNERYPTTVEILTINEVFTKQKQE